MPERQSRELTSPYRSTLERGTDDLYTAAATPSLSHFKKILASWPRMGYARLGHTRSSNTVLVNFLFSLQGGARWNRSPDTTPSNSSESHQYRCMRASTNPQFEPITGYNPSNPWEFHKYRCMRASTNQPSNYNFSDRRLSISIEARKCPLTRKKKTYTKM